MKNKKIVCLIFPFLFSLYIFVSAENSQPEKGDVLDKLKDPKQYIERNNESMKQGKEIETTLDKNDHTSRKTDSWFLQHQDVWGTEQSNTISPEGENRPPESSTVSGNSSWIYYFFRTVIALIFVIGLILVLLGGLRYFSRKTYSGVKSIGRIVGALYLSPRSKIYYVHSAGKVFLLGISGDRMSLLFTFPEDEFFASVSNEEDTSFQQKTFSKVLEDVETRLQSRASSEKPEFVENIDDELASLKANIQRLQQAIREETNNASDQ